jgi:formylglycine-generating enzyme required for sulfatase activity
MIRISAAILALMCMLVGLQASAKTSTNTHGIAVIIGNKTYPGRIPDAEYAHNDAAAMKKFVIDRLGYRTGNIIDLRDATKGQLEAVFGSKDSHKGKLFNWMRARKSDVVVFYSGHGVPGLRDKRGYLLPVDGDPNLAELTGYPVDRLYTNLAKLPARSVTVFLDACFSGESPKGMLVQATSGLTVTPRRPRSARRLTVLTAAQGDQFASWDEDAQHGLFTRHLLLALSGRADGSSYGNGDGKVTLGETKKYLDEEMTYQARRRFGRKQVASVQGRGNTMLASYVPGQETASFSPPSTQVDEVDASYFALKTANVRSGPGTTFSKVGKLSPGTEVDVTGKVQGKDWYRVALADGGQGFVWSRLLSDRERKVKPRENTKVAVGVYPKNYKPGDTFKDCRDCPEMVVVPPGRFRMGDLSGKGYEKPVHYVQFAYNFAVGKFEVTQTQWQSVMGENPSRFKGANRPVEGVDWNDVQEFLKILNARTGQRYRLLSESEWEYTARAGTTTAFSTGNRITTDQANFDGDLTFNGSKKGINRKKTTSVGSFRPNAFGLYDMHGNVWELVEDCFELWRGTTYGDAPTNGSALVPRFSSDVCEAHVIRGGAFNFEPGAMRSAHRDKCETYYSSGNIGFRVARTLSP